MHWKARGGTWVPELVIARLPDSQHLIESGLCCWSLIIGFVRARVVAGTLSVVGGSVAVTSNL